MTKSNNNKSRKTNRKDETKQPKQRKRSSGTSEKSFFTNQRLHLIILFVFGFLLYANTLSHDYTVDDAIVITENDFVKQGFAGIPKILGNDTFLGFFKVEKNLVAGGRYRPLSLVTFAMEYQIFGESPTVSHFVNVLLYALTGMLLYLVVMQLFRTKRTTTEAHFVALATAMLFLAHPIHTEAVANIKGRDEIMALLGSLAALYFAMRYLFKGGVLQLIFAGVCFFLGILSKENTITFLAVIPLAMYIFSPKNSEKIGSKIGIAFGVLVGVAAVFLLIRSSILGDAASLSANTNMELMNNPYLKFTGSQYIAFSGAEKFGTIFYTLGKYLILLIFPYSLTHDYYPPQIPMMTFGDWQVILAFLIYFAAGIYALIRLPKRDPIAFGILYFVLTLSIVSNLFFPIGSNMGERFIFMPSVGFSLICGVLLYKLSNQKLVKLTDLKLALPILAIVLIGYSAKTILRNPAWKNNYTLFSTDIETSVNSAKLNNAMAGITIEESNKPENAAQRQAMLQQAVQYGQKAIELHPTYANPYVLLGNAHIYLEDYAKANEYYNYVLSITGEGSSDNKNAKNNKGLALAQMQTKYIQLQNFQSAIKVGEEAISLGQSSIELFGQQGAAYGSLGQHQKALEMFQKVLAIDTNSAQAYLNIGFAYQALGDVANANVNFQKAYQLDPSLKR
jgi:Flp pilus assembly protein TadD